VYTNPTTTIQLLSSGVRYVCVSTQCSEDIKQDYHFIDTASLNNNGAQNARGGCGASNNIYRYIQGAPDDIVSLLGHIQARSVKWPSGFIL